MESVNMLGYRLNISRKDIRHGYIRIDLLTGEINLSVPRDTSLEEIEAILVSKRGWIEETMDLRRSRKVIPELNPDLGASNYFFGRQYKISYEYIESFPEYVEIRGDSICLHIKKARSREKKKELLREFYRQELLERIGIYIDKWQKITGLKVSEYRTRQMKTRWGSCNINKKRIWFNLDLARLDEKFLEYIVVHEMMHLLEKGHGRRFQLLMDRYLGNWRQLKQELNQYIIL